MATGPSGNVVQGGLQLRLQRYQLLCNQSGGVAVTVLRDNFGYNKRLGRKLRLDTIGRKPNQGSNLREAELETDLPRTETALHFLGSVETDLHGQRPDAGETFGNLKHNGLTTVGKKHDHFGENAESNAG